MKNFKRLLSSSLLLFLVGSFLLRSANAQAHPNKVLITASAANYQLASVSSISSSDVWAVGKTGTANAFSSLIEHWDGTSWQIISSPNPLGAIDTELTAVTALSTSDVWAVGFASISGQPAQQSVIEHWDGTSWSLIASPNQPGNTILQAVTALSASDVWAVGDYIDTSGRELSLTEHWDGSQWQIVSSPNQSAAFNELTGIQANSAQDVWAVGYALGYAPAGSIVAGIHPLGGIDTFSGFHPLVEHWNGIAWSAVTTPDPPETRQQVYQSVTAASATNIWAVGHSFTNSNSFAFIAHWNGTSWQTVQSPTPGINSTLTSVTALSSQDIWAVGSYHVDANSAAIPLTEHWDGQQWTVVSSPSGDVGYVEAYGVSAISSQDAWFVGGNGLTEHWDGTDWQVVATPIS